VELLLRGQLQLFGFDAKPLDESGGIVGAVAFLNGGVEDPANDVQSTIKTGGAVMFAVAGGPFPANRPRADA
jgi:hypothetical protein